MRRHMNSAIFVAALGMLAVCGSPSFAQTPPAGNRFEKDVQAYEAKDKITPPPKGAILLAGDSQFFR